MALIISREQLAYLGITTPAFSHAWINAEPAVAMVSNLSTVPLSELRPTLN